MREEGGYVRENGPKLRWWIVKGPLHIASSVCVPSPPGRGMLQVFSCMISDDFLCGVRVDLHHSICRVE